ncbi:MAG: DUF4139 domain-containing protein [Prevotellaceae bacterium]|jgi:uncharacterized protein (TIGR02231 family)|nr:DUF4139 domain-containing protein [Prevotellaceae bacterium]
MTTATAQEAKTIMSKLEEATVFFKGAELTYTANATVNKGDNELLIEGLSPNVDKNSLKIKTTNNVVVSSFEFSIDYLSATKAIAPTLKKIEDSISVFQSALDKVIIDIKVNTNMITQLQEGIKKNISGSEKGLGIDELMKAMDYYKSKSEVLEMNQVTYNQKKRQIEESIQKLRAHLNQESGKGNKTSGVLKLKVTALTATPTKLTISYYTPSATWSPYYDINITSTDKPVAIILKSKVVQTTGIDWEKITLHLSTATPSNGKIAPLFSVWFLAPLRPIPVAREMKMAMQNSYSYDVQASYAIVEEMEVADMASPITMDDYVKATEQAMNVVYSIDLPYTIPGNGKEQNIELQRKEAAAEYKYYCAPKLDSETYLLAELLDREKLELLSAPANLTYDGTYLGDTYVNASSTQDKLSLTLGSDKRVTVKREKMQDFSTTRFLGNDVIQIFTYKLTVKNNQNKRVMMVLKDQYPISTQKSIEVTLLRKETTPWSTNNEEVGVLTWEGELAAGETKTYQISFSVKYPKDLNLNL